MSARNRTVSVLAVTAGLLAVLTLTGGTANADTILIPGGDVRLDSGWSNLKPSSTNPGTITVDGVFAASVFGYGAGAVITHTAGDIVGTGTNGLNINAGVIWNMSGGKIVGRYILANGGSTFFNFSGGTAELADVASTQHMGVANGGTLKISGSAVLDGTHATTVVQTGGTLDIASGWTGSWTWATHSGDDWKNLFTGDLIEVDGANIDGATFDATFQVSDGGKTLTMIPEPATMSLIALGGLALLRRRRNRL